MREFIEPQLITNTELKIQAGVASSQVHVYPRAAEYLEAKAIDAPERPIASTSTEEIRRAEAKEAAYLASKGILSSR